MKKKAFQSPSQLSPLQNSTALASVLQKISQALLDDCTGQCPVPLKGKADTSKDSASTPEQAKPPRAVRHPGRPVSSGAISSQNPSKRAKCRNKAIALAYDHRDLTAFADKELAKSFDEAYANGNFRDEVRYYHVPAYMVRFEQKWLRQHQQDTIMDLLFEVHNDLNLQGKLITYMEVEAGTDNLSFVQLGESILRPVQLLQAIHSLLTSFKLVHKTTLPCQREVEPGADL